MPRHDQERSAPDQRRSPGTIEQLRRRPGRAVVIAAVPAVLVAGFAYAGGWLTPDRLSPARMIDRLESAAGGPHHGFRRAHAKGICIAGAFKASPAARSWSTAAVFRGDAIPVTGRLAEATANPFAADATVGVRSMALRLRPAAGGEWRTGMNDTPGLPVSTPQDFYDFAQASAPDPRTGKPDPARMHAFVARHPETAAFLARAAAKPLAATFVSDSYDSVNGFIFVGPDGARRLVRWTMRAQAPFTSLTPTERAHAPANHLFDDLLRQVAAGPLRWRLIATFAEPGDPNRAAEVWPAGRRQVDMGELTITHVESEARGNCRDLNFDPLILPPGIEASDDPIPYARSAAYSTSFRRRMGEPKPPSVVADRQAGAPQ